MVFSFTDILQNLMPLGESKLNEYKTATLDFLSGAKSVGAPVEDSVFKTIGDFFTKIWESIKSFLPGGSDKKEEPETSNQLTSNNQPPVTQKNDPEVVRLPVPNLKQKTKSLS